MLKRWKYSLRDIRGEGRGVCLFQKKIWENILSQRKKTEMASHFKVARWRTEDKKHMICSIHTAKKTFRNCLLLLWRDLSYFWQIPMRFISFSTHEQCLHNLTCKWSCKLNSSMFCKSSKILVASNRTNEFQLVFFIFIWNAINICYYKNYCICKLANQYLVSFNS